MSGSEKTERRKAAAAKAPVRAVIEAVMPAVDGGRFPIKRVLGEEVVVEADCFADGHDELACLLLYRNDSDTAWESVPMIALGNDRWRAAFTVERIGVYRYTVTAWVDAFLSWRHDFARRVDAEDLLVAAQLGAALIDGVASRAKAGAKRRLAAWAKRLRREQDPAALATLGLDEDLFSLAKEYPDRSFAATHPVELSVRVDRDRARYSTWYELFPRSFGPATGAHGTFKDCGAVLPYVAAMGFDVLYFPPIHPIGRGRRKGPNNSLIASAGDVGSPWAIGALEGGHTAVHPALGTLADFRELIKLAGEHGLEVALDIAFQCAPDHPWVKEHPEWFRWRPDGTVQYAENPPKKYQDIYPFNFDCGEWQDLWNALEDVFLFWIGEGVRIFRVDNPHTKPFAFWEWLIARVCRDHPDVIFLAEAFTRPKIMHRLAKLGFSQSYTYFTWRNTKHELTEYFTELAHDPSREYFRPNCWPNTPDILNEYLQVGGRPAFMARVVLAATLSANYGIYGPAFELMEHIPREPGSEEYRDSEKYQLRHWDLSRTDSLADFIGRINRARRDNSALQQDWSLRFFAVDNEQLICYAKTSAGLDSVFDNIVVVVVNLDPWHTQSGWVDIDLSALGMEEDSTYQMHDLLTDARYLWHGRRNFVQLDPARTPAHVLRLRRRVKSEHAFDYFA
ncbi:MAG: alpha-1,4-glucan--maltose-1-phosphate maltosyltransferase [Betaproteobacteria bacterium]|nr:MAG: alpha-1,4-glucan--maltose-1-phosphate maltosyltransferase [Betaproteobacteria bacterium]